MSAENKSLILIGRKILIEGHVGPARVFIENGRIAKIEKGAAADREMPKGRDRQTPASVVDAGDFTVIPGIVDTHAHINEPGRTEWEGFQTATRAAAAGGVTTVIDMPLNSIPPTTTAHNLDVKFKAAREACLIDFGFWGGLIPGNLQDLHDLVAQGVAGCKAFMCESGVPEFPMSREEDLRAGMKILAGYGVPLIVHAELVTDEPPAGPGSASRAYRDYLDSRPERFEVDAIRLLIKLTRETGCHCHIVHLSAAAALDEIHRARAEGLPLTVETCPHYLTFEAEQIPDGATFFKCAPPIRAHENRERLWQGLVDGDIDMIVSDHSPCTPQLKNLEKGDFQKAWGGISGIQMSFPAILTEMRRRGLDLKMLSQWMSRAPAELAGLGGAKGRLALGLDADFVIFDPEARFTLHDRELYTRHSLSPYNGGEYYGKVLKTYVRGISVYDSESPQPFAAPCPGQRVKRGEIRKQP